MKIAMTYSPNFSEEEIDPQFLILHYTALDLPGTLAHFAKKESKVCAHFVIAEDGVIFDLGGFLHGPILMGAHAGKSFFELNGKIFENFNRISIGIELVNANGNFIAYPDAQYTALSYLVEHFKKRFPVFSDPQRILGHEQIAGHRGKIDPGCLFDWQRFFSIAYPDHSNPYPVRIPRLDANILKEYERIHGPLQPPTESEAWATLNTRLEAYIQSLTA